MWLLARPGPVLGIFLATVALSFSAGCSESSTDPADPDPTGPADPDPTGPADPSNPWQLTVEETAEALGDPDRAEDGVRSILANLGVGVYSANATQIFAGSETSAQDLWLYDFEIPALARGAIEESVPFTRFAAAVASAGASVGAETLLAHYRNAYSAQPGAFLVALLDETGLTLEGSPQTVHLTPLQEWLLFLDAFVPPPVASGGVGPVTAPVDGGSFILPAQTDGCSGFQGAGLTPGWGVAGPPADLPAHADPTTILQLATLRQMLNADIQLSNEEAHHLQPEGNHDVPPHTMVLAAVVGFDHVPPPVSPCRTDLWGAFTGLTPGPDGRRGIPGVLVEWNLDFEFFEEHGALERDDGGPWFPGVPGLTGQDGRTELHFTAKDEATRGLGVETLDSRLVTASFELGGGLQQVFPLVDPSVIQSFIEPVHHAVPQLVTVEWHEGFEVTLWAGWSSHAFAFDPGAIAGAESRVGFDPPTSARSPLDLPELSVESCGMFSEGLLLDGLQLFQADASAAGQTAWMSVVSEKAEDGFTASIEFTGHAAGAAVSHQGSAAEASTESLVDRGMDPAVYVFHIENPGADTVQLNVVWEYEGELAGEAEYSQWWVDAVLRVRSCDEEDGGPDSEWDTPFLGYDDEFPGPGSGAGQVVITEELVQVQLILMAGVLANARLQDDQGLPPVESSASVEGSLTFSIHSSHDPEAPAPPSDPGLQSTSLTSGFERTRRGRGPP